MIEEPRYRVSQGYAFGEPVFPPVYWLYEDGARKAPFDSAADANYIAALLNLATEEQKAAALRSLYTEAA